MNKQEAIEQVKNKSFHHCGEIQCYKGGCEKSIELNTALEIINQIDETKKVVIPKFVAEWLEYSKNLKVSLLMAMSEACSDEVFEYLLTNSDTFAKAWLYGYEVEKEKLYTVEIPNPHYPGHMCLSIFNEMVSLSHTMNNNWKTLDDYQLTKSEICKDFEWAFRFAKEVQENNEQR